MLYTRGATGVMMGPTGPAVLYPKKFIFLFPFFIQQRSTGANCGSFCKHGLLRPNDKKEDKPEHAWLRGKLGESIFWYTSYFYTHFLYVVRCLCALRAPKWGSAISVPVLYRWPSCSENVRTCPSRFCWGSAEVAHRQTHILNTSWLVQNWQDIISCVLARFLKHFGVFGCTAWRVAGGVLGVADFAFTLHLRAAWAITYVCLPKGIVVVGIGRRSDNSVENYAYTSITCLIRKLCSASVRKRQA
jgi:hypothetical protein